MYQANRCLEVVSKMFSLAEIWGLRPDGTNPRKHIRKYPEEERERFFSAAELRRIGEVLREMEAEGIELPSGIFAARLLILAGCRQAFNFEISEPLVRPGIGPAGVGLLGIPGSASSPSITGSARGSARPIGLRRRARRSASTGI